MISSRAFKEPQSYRITVRGQLGQNWADWFDGFTITMPEGDNSVLTGHVADQAALHGVLARIRDLGLPLLCVECIDSDHSCG
jgi:hypothetical protein